MAGEGEFQGRIERIEELIHRLEAIPDAAQRNQMRELLQAVLELHGAALERMLAIVAEVGTRSCALATHCYATRWWPACCCYTGCTRTI